VDDDFRGKEAVNEKNRYDEAKVEEKVINTPLKQ